MSADSREPYRSQPSKLPPELAARLTELRLPTTPRGIAAKSAETPKLCRELLRGRGFGRWLRGALFISRPLNRCSLKAIPEPAQTAAQEIGFEPLVWMLHGPILPITTPHFIGPEGFVRLEVFGGRRMYLSTYFEDASAITTAPQNGMNRRTRYLKATGDFRHDYSSQIEQVLAEVRESGNQPMYRASVPALVASFRLFPAYYMP